VKETNRQRLDALYAEALPYSAGDADCPRWNSYEYCLHVISHISERSDTDSFTIPISDFSFCFSRKLMRKVALVLLRQYELENNSTTLFQVLVISLFIRYIENGGSLTEQEVSLKQLELQRRYSITDDLLLDGELWFSFVDVLEADYDYGIENADAIDALCNQLSSTDSLTIRRVTHAINTIAAMLLQNYQSLQ
jgi:hypothetical protein